jgi:hypothetical protein
MRLNHYGFRGNPASPHFLNCQIINNESHGIYLSGASVPTFGSNLAEWNDIYGNGGYNIYNGTENITAGYVYWGVLDSASIAMTIYDHYDLATLGIVNFFPWTNAAHDQLYPGEFLPEPEVVIYTDCDDVSCQHIYLVWDPIPGATSYRVYSSDNPDTGFLEDLTGTYLGSGWVAPFPDEDMFYYVIARN